MSDAKNVLKVIKGTQGIGREGEIIRVYYDDHAQDLIDRGIAARATEKEYAAQEAGAKEAEKPPVDKAARKGGKRGAVTKAVVVALLLSLVGVGGALAGAPINLAASAARTATGNGNAFDLSNYQWCLFQVVVTAGSGTVTTFRVDLQGQVNGTDWGDIPCDIRAKTDSAALAAGSAHVADETAVVTSAVYVGLCHVLGLNNVRAQWEIAGTTPSETFRADAVCR